MLERLDRIETRLAGVESSMVSVTGRLADVETRLDGVETRLVRVETKLGRVETKIQSVETTLNDKMDAQGRRFDVQMESLRDMIAMLAQNVDGRFDALSRQLAEGAQVWQGRFSDHEGILRNHNDRITALERRPRNRT